MPERSSTAEYFKLFRGEQASLNLIVEENPHLQSTIDTMVHLGSLVGQRSFLNEETELEQDIIYIMPDKGGDFNGTE